MNLITLINESYDLQNLNENIYYISSNLVMWY
jgi:hypothetical protein